MTFESRNCLGPKGLRLATSLLSVLVALLAAGCFQSPHVNKDNMVCQTDDNCLPGYVCVIKQPGVPGSCKSLRDSGTDAVAASDSPIADVVSKGDGASYDGVGGTALDSLPDVKQPGLLDALGNLDLNIPALPDAFNPATAGDGPGSSGTVDAPEIVGPLTDAPQVRPEDAGHGEGLRKDASPADAPVGGNGGVGGSGGTGGATGTTGGTTVTTGGTTVTAGGAGAGGTSAGGTATGGDGGIPSGGAGAGGTSAGGSSVGGTSAGGTSAGGTSAGGTSSGGASGCVETSTRPCSQAGLLGSCASGNQTCTSGAWGACSIAPKAADTCVDGNDDTCDGTPNEGCACVAEQTRPCAGALGSCAAGSQTCSSTGTWSVCSILPAAQDTCVAGNDANCNGTPNEGCACVSGNTRPCLGAQGVCAAGSETCSASGTWSSCSIQPGARNCGSSADNDCNGVQDNTIDSVCKCPIGGKKPCGMHPEDGTGTCKAGEQTCVGLAGNTSSDYGSCLGSIGPVAEICDGVADENCNGKIDDGCPCPNLSGPSMVRVPEAYCIDSTEVTRGQYLAWLNTGPVLPTDSTCNYLTSYTPICEWPPTAGGVDRSNHPVVCVDWCAAKAYCQGVGKRLCGQIGGGSVYISTINDITKSQWYNACTSHGANEYTYGNTFLPSACNINKIKSDGVPAPTSAVGSMSGCQSSVPGYTGIYDMSGNALEWEDSCGDSTANAYCRVLGGSWGHSQEYVDCDIASVSEFYFPRKTRMDNVGFRCCYQ